MDRILIVEDEPQIARLLADYFTKEGAQPHIIGHGDQVLGYLAQHAVDAILLDVMLPGKDGLTLCREIRQTSDIPILMVTARVDEIDRLLGLELGADDYICKPYSPREVIARTKTILRRVRGELLRKRNWQLDEGRFEFLKGEGRVALTSVEFLMLRKLCSDPGRIYSRAQLMEQMYDDHRVVSERTVDSHIKKLRKKIEPVYPGFIESVYGVGYRIAE